MSREKNKTDRIAGLILSAGYSSRMGDFKPLLPFGKYNTLTMQIRNFQKAGIQDIRVVIGHNAEKLITFIENAGAKWVLNPDYDKGMFSSIQAGARNLQNSSFNAFFLLPVDCPLIQWRTIRSLLETYRKNRVNIMYPCFKGKRGHPPLISTDYIDEILCFEGTGGLRQILKRHEDQSLNIEVDDESILWDMDTKDDYNRLSKYFYEYRYPEKEQCFKLLEKQKVHKKIIEHGKKVAEIGEILCTALEQKGHLLNINWIICAGLLHDIARGQPGHAKVGKEIVLRELGCQEIAEIIGCHMDLGEKSPEIIDETAVVYLADKLVRETKIVSLNERMQTTLEKFKDEQSVIPFAIKRIQKAQQIKKEIEKILGVELKKIIL
jgi:molybdenum cofactor cytidylyltransferase